MERLLIATNNPHKVEEIKKALTNLPGNIDIISLFDLAPLPEVEETGATFEENAILKATQYANATGELVMADDSGLEVDILAGAPGISSARWSGVTGEERYRANNQKLLNALAGIPPEKRKARFVSVIALARPQKLIFTVRGVCEGVIIQSLKGIHGFGYDPLFEIPSYGKTMAELDMDEKNKISHRGQAVAKFLEKFLEYVSHG